MQGGVLVERTEDVFDVHAGAPKDSDCVQRVCVCHHAPPGEQAVGRLETDNAAVGSGEADRATGVST